MKQSKVLWIAWIAMCLFFAGGVSAATSELLYMTSVGGVSFLPETIYAGDIVTVAIDINNEGTSYSIVDLNGFLNLGSQFESIDVINNIPAIQPETSKVLIFKFRVKEDTIPGYYTAGLVVEYEREYKGEIVKSGQNIRSPETHTIIIPVSRSSKNIDITLSPSVINPGNKTELVFTLENVSGLSISNISFSWRESTSLILPIGSDNKKYVSLLNDGDKVGLTYLVAADPNIETGIYPLAVELTFTDATGQRTQESQVGLLVGGGTDFEISAETTSSQLSISIANIGSNNANAVVVKIPQQPNVNISGSNTSILGNLNQGDYTLATFIMQSSFGNLTDSIEAIPRGAQEPNMEGPNMGGSNIENRSSVRDNNFSRKDMNASLKEVTVQIDYTDTTGERQSVLKKVALSSNTVALTSGISSRKTATPDLTIPLISLGIILAAGILFNKFKAKKDWKRVLIIAGISIVLFGVTILLFNSNIIGVAISGIISIGLFVLFFLNKQIPFLNEPVVLLKKK